MPIDRVKVRATIRVGNLVVSTPFIQSFTVNKRRGQVSTFDASMKVSHESVAGTITGDNVSISAGEDSASDLIFTGIVRQAKISPCYDDPKYVMLSISGADPMSLLQGKKYTRRCRSTKTAWVAITGLARRGLKSGKFAYQNEPRFVLNGGDLQRTSNNTLFRPNSGADTITAAKAPDKNTTAPVQLHVTHINPETGGTGETNP